MSQARITAALGAAAFLFALAANAAAETVLALRTIRPQSIISSADVEMSDQSLTGAADHLDLVVGMEARVALYAGRPIHPGDVGPPATVERNALVSLIYDNGSLSMETEGRALDRGGPGDRLRVMNLASRRIVTARIAEDGTIHVNQ